MLVVVTLIGAAAFGVLCATWSAIVVARGEYLTAIVMLGFAISLCSIVLAMIMVHLGHVRLRAESDSTGTMLSADRTVSWLFCIAIVAFIPSGTLFTVFVPGGGLDIPMMTAGQRVFYPIVMGFIVLWCFIGLGSAMARGGVGHVRLTPRGFETADIFFTKRGSWADVTDITDEAPDGKGRFPAVMVMKDDAPQVINGLDYFVPRGTALYWMIRHYWKHPDSRAELTDGRALQRLRDEQFDVE